MKNIIICHNSSYKNNDIINRKSIINNNNNNNTTDNNNITNINNNNININNNDDDNDNDNKNNKILNKQNFQLLESDLIEKFIKGGGNGGQSINKTSNMVQLKHIPSGIVIECQKTRELQANRKIARKILRDRLEFLNYGNDSKIGKKILKIQKNKSKSRSRELKKYHNNIDNNDNNEEN